MKFVELVNSGENKPQQHEHLDDGRQMVIIIHALSNLEEAAVEAGNLKGLNFGVFMRMRMIEKFAKKEKEAA